MSSLWAFNSMAFTFGVVSILQMVKELAEVMEENGQMYFDNPDRIPPQDVKRLKEAERELLSKAQDEMEVAQADLHRQKEEARTQSKDRPRGEAMDEEARKGPPTNFSEAIDFWNSFGPPLPEEGWHDLGQIQEES